MSPAFAGAGHLSLAVITIYFRTRAPDAQWSFKWECYLVLGKFSLEVLELPLRRICAFRGHRNVPDRALLGARCESFRLFGPLARISTLR